MVNPLLETRASVEIENDAFRTEYTPRVNPNALRKDIESYLGEYRFRVEQYGYELLFTPSSDGKIHLTDIDDKEPMIIKAQRAIGRRIKEGKNITREEAELQGLINLESQLYQANEGNEIIWISPPGLKSEGYGNYGFIYIGKINRVDGSGQEKHLSMSAIRVENPTMQQFNSALTILTGKKVTFAQPEEFLASPEVVSGFLGNYKKILAYIFNLQPDGKNNSLFKKIIPLLSPYVQEFIDYVKQGVPKEFLFQAFQTVELLALDLIKEFSEKANPQLYFINRDSPLSFAITNYHDRTPPPVAGSCGSTKSSTNEITSANIFNKSSSFSVLFSKEDDSNLFVCPKCGFATAERVGNQCPGCKITKEEAVEQGYVTC